MEGHRYEEVGVVSYIFNVSVDVVGQAEQEAVPLEHGERIARGVCSVLAPQHVTEQRLRPLRRLYRERRVKGEGVRV